MSRNWLLLGAALGLMPSGAWAVAADTEAAGAATESADSADAGEMITVTATRSPTAVDKVPVTVTVIDDAQIADQLAGDVKDLVRFEPGVSVRRAPARFGAAFGSTGRDGNSGFNIRGIGGNRVLIQVDGVRVPDGFSFGAQAAGRGDYVDVGLVKSVEILRGPASALYGSDGLAGAVSFVTTDPSDLLGAGRSFAALGRAGYESASDEFSETAVLAGGSGDVSALIGYTRRDGDELDTRGDVGGAGATRTKANPQDTKSNALLGKLVFTPAPGHRIRLTGEYSDGRVETDVLSARNTLAFPTSTASLTARDEVERKRVTLDWRYEGKGMIDSASAAVYWQDSENSQFAFEDRVVSADRERLNTFDNRVLGAAAEAHSSFATGPVGHRLAFGGDLSVTRQSGVRDGTVPPFGETFPTAAFPKTDYLLAGLFLADEVELADGRLTLHPALRFDHYKLDPKHEPLLPDFDAAGQSGSRLTPRIGAVGQLGGGFSLYANYAMGFKAPSPTEVNQFFANPGMFYSSIPNPDLKPETSRAFEAGLRYSRGHLSASLTGFTGKYKDFISQVVVSGQLGNPANPGVFQFVNLDRVKVKGIEGRAALALPNGFNADAAFAWADGKVSNGNALSTVDPLKLVAGAGWRDPAGRFGGQLILTHSARKKREDTEGVCTGKCFRPGAFTILDATAFYRIGEGVTVRAGLFNITNDKYAWWSDVIGLSATAPDHDAYTQPGRNVRVSLSYTY
jgi:hemoglobin/transferrin/lactoferrin receptor protein